MLQEKPWRTRFQRPRVFQPTFASKTRVEGLEEFGIPYFKGAKGKVLPKTAFHYSKEWNISIFYFEKYSRNKDFDPIRN